MIEQLDNWVLSILPQFLGIFTHYSFGFLALFLLLGLALISIMCLVHQSRLARRQIDQALSIVGQSADPKEFTEKFHLIDGSMQKLPLYRRLWEEFSETLIPPLEHVDDPSYRVYRNTKRPQEFLSPDELLADVRPLMNGERLVGLGLILTFLGLVAALSEAGTAFKLGGSAGNAEIIKQALATLLATAGAKFLASIGGLGGSIVQSMVQNHVVGRAESHLAEFNDLLEARLSFVPLERIAADHYGHAQRQTTRLEEMGTEITLALGNSIEQALHSMPAMIGTELTKALEPVSANLGNMTENMSSNTSDALGNIVDQFREQVQGAGEQTMNHMVSQLDSISGVLTTTVASLSQGNEEIRQGLEQTMQALTNTAEKLETSMEGGAKAATDQMMTTSESIQSMMRELLNDAQASRSEQQQAIEQLSEKFTRSSTEIAETMTARATDAGKDIASAMATTVERILTQAESSTDQLAKDVQAGVQEANTQAQREMEQFMGQASTQLQSAVSDVEKGLTSWLKETARVNKVLKDLGVELDRNTQNLVKSNDSISASSDAFSGVAASVQSAIRPLVMAADQANQSVDALSSSTKQATDQLTALYKSIESAVEQTRASVETLAEQWQQQAGQLSHVDADLEKAFKSISSTLSSSLEKLRGYSTETSKELGDAVSMLSALVEDLSETVEELKRD